MSSLASRFSLKRITAPAFLPVSVAEAREYCRIVHQEDDALIKRNIEAATGYVEAHLRRALATATWRLKLDFWPCADDANPWGSIEVPRPPLQSVTSIAYIDTDGDSQTWASSNYAVDSDSEPGRISLAYGASWPTVRSVHMPITITYVAGYTSAERAPAIIKTAIAAWAAHLLENPEPVVVGQTANKIPMHVQSLLDAASVGDLVCA